MNNNHNTNAKSQYDFASDSYYKILDVLYENTKPIQGMGLNSMFGNAFFGVEGLQDIEGDVVKRRIMNIADSQRYISDKQIERLIKDLTPQRFKELMFLMQQIDNKDIVDYYNKLCKGINDNALITMRVIAYDISREEARKQVAEVDSFLGL